LTYEVIFGHSLVTTFCKLAVAIPPWRPTFTTLDTGNDPSIKRIKLIRASCCLVFGYRRFIQHAVWTTVDIGVTVCLTITRSWVALLSVGHCNF
jgi:hypothetical protein